MLSGNIYEYLENGLWQLKKNYYDLPIPSLLIGGLTE